MKGRNIPYSAAEMVWLEARQETPRRQLHAEFVRAFDRHDVSLDNFKAMCTRRGFKTGRTGCFPKGNAPFNKGVPHSGAQHPNAMAARFKKGAGRHGVAVKLYKPIGTERLCKDGYRERKIHDGMPLQSRWRAVHLIEWEQANGPIPAGHCLKCLGDRLNTEPTNWQLIPRAMLPRLNGGRHKTRVAYDEAPAELKPTIMAVAKLDHLAREKRKAAA